MSRCDLRPYCFFFNDTATTEIYTLSLHDALPILVNSAYVAAVEADGALAVIRAGIELVDESEGRSPLSQAAAVREKGEAVARTVPATIAGERRMMRVVEVPLGETGVAGYAIDVEDRAQARADLARFVRAQRDMLDRLP